ncbi:MAG: hypothetical protein AVDCRST_MAG18-3532, partial [uncultured Thermomicrobiales bacterium]
GAVRYRYQAPAHGRPRGHQACGARGDDQDGDRPARHQQ